jgi:hypothetical protein
LGNSFGLGKSRASEKGYPWQSEIDDLVERAAFNESQKTFQQMSQKESLQLAKDVYKFDMMT